VRQVARRLTREESAALTRARLLKAAQRVFLARGFHAASLEAVAEEAGFTKGAVYSRFESKADLFLALLAERNEERVRSVAEKLATVETSEKLARFFPDYWATRLREGPEWTLVLIEFWASACRDPILGERFSREHERLMERVGSLIDEAADRVGAALASPGIDLTRVSTALAHGIALEQLVSPEEVDADFVTWAFTPIADLASPARGSADGHRRQRGSPSRPLRRTKRM
jgi:AcrR family transcriptional regulator